MTIRTAETVAFESVYSMDGDFGRRKSAIADEFDTLTYRRIHAVGLYGDEGSQRRAMLGLANTSTSSSTLAKGFGVMGGYIIIQPPSLTPFARWLRSTSTCPVMAIGALTGIANCAPMKAAACLCSSAESRAAETEILDAGLPVMESPSRIVPLLNRAGTLPRRFVTLLFDFGIVQPINYPTVPRGTNASASRRAVHDSNDGRTRRRRHAVWKQLGLDKPPSLTYGRLRPSFWLIGRPPGPVVWTPSGASVISFSRPICFAWRGTAA